MKTVTVLLLMMMMMMTTHCTSRHSSSSPHRLRRRDKEMAPPKEFSSWHSYNERFLTHLGTQPSALGPYELKKHLNTLLRQLDFLPTVNAYLDTHLRQVHNSTQAHTIFTLLDLFSAQEPHRYRHLHQIREAFTEVFNNYPEFGKNTVPSQFFFDGFDRHVKKMKSDSKEMYRRVFLPSPENADLVSYYIPGRLPSLELALTRLYLPSPFLVLSEDQQYQVTQANKPHLSLSVHLNTWRLTLANHSLQHALFRFDKVHEQFGAVRYALRSAVLPRNTHLSHPCLQDTLCFDYQRPAEVQVVVLPDGEVAISHRLGPRTYFLTAGIEPGTKDEESGSEPRFVHGYPGRSAHWVLVPRP